MYNKVAPTVVAVSTINIPHHLPKTNPDNNSKGIANPSRSTQIIQKMKKAIERNKKPKSSGSFIGVLNLITDKAPTNPSDNANEDFTTSITKKVIFANNGIIGDI